MGFDVRPAGISTSGLQAQEAPDNTVTTVQLGESKLSDVARRLGISEAALQQANPDIGSSVKPGQSVRLPLLQSPTVAGAPPDDAAGDPVLNQNPTLSPQGTRTDRDLSSDVIRSRINGGTMLAGPAKGTAVAQAQLVGMRLGATAAGSEVHVTREIGSPAGYDNRYEAIGVDRMSGAENSAVVQGKDGKWHAVETNQTLPPNGATSDLHAEGLPAYSSIAAARQQIQALQATSDALGTEIDTLKVAGGSTKDVQAQKDAIDQQISQSFQPLAAKVFGVPESEINTTLRLEDGKPGMINIYPKSTTGNPAGDFHVKGSETGDPPSYDQHHDGSVNLRRDEIGDPQKAGQILYHESSHALDHEITEQWVQKYKSDTGRIFSDLPAAQGPFDDWMRKQAPKNISPADAETVISQARHDNGATEARANVHSAIQALDAGQPALATSALKNYVGAIKNGQYASPSPGAQAALADELHATYRQMTPAMQKQFQDALAAAKAEYPDAWISKLKF